MLVCQTVNSGPRRHISLLKVIWNILWTFILFIQSSNELLWKEKWSWENHLWYSAGKFRPVYLLPVTTTTTIIIIIIKRRLISRRNMPEDITRARKQCATSTWHAEACVLPSTIQFTDRSSPWLYCYTSATITFGFLSFSFFSSIIN